ncbi:2OG-Fe(II) oxygenase [Allopusillimonas ginsengisoli]|uniref:2OG-Fe(II) oxygenase n=1 Tax=Allopusillimonas ginsengisoli TaxID=453575 RepID=UPI0010C1AC51|nr:2OG-Fe(II) oxygenase [Allopusillimonas ginsengisoli]
MWRCDFGLHGQKIKCTCYGKGYGYKKHIDQHRHSGHRKTSIVLYLNLQWNPI